ncbi:MAG: class D sortase [bacterium]|nr:class D sortase [bacterium]
MDEDKKNNQFDAALPLPSTGQNAALPGVEGKEDTPNPAADLIRQKIDAAYVNEPSVSAEAGEVELISPTTELSKHQQFVNTLVNSGKSLVDIQTAWHEYYQGLPDEQKHEVWQEFYIMHAQTSQFAAAAGLATTTQPKAEPLPQIPTRRKASTPVGRTLGELHSRVKKNVAKTKGYKPPKHVQSLLFGLAAGTGALIIVLFSFFNERFIAPFIQPSRNVTNTPLISNSSTVSATPEIIIPKINVEIPVVYGINTIDESAIDVGLENGVVHYADTAEPGQNGNLVIVGHSSNNIFNKGKYKFAFVLLSRLEIGDTFYLQKDGKRYTYQVYKSEIVDPTDISVLGPRDKPATATLITCDPPGTSLKRLVVVGEQISPSTADNAPQVSQNTLATQSAKIPGNSESLWHRLTRWLTQ